MRDKDVEHCERTGRIVGHCGCGNCYARRLAKLAVEDPSRRSVSRSTAGSPRYLVTNAL
jgi:hypothetical protein